MKISWKKYTLNFKQPSGTSRGMLYTKDSYFIIIEKGEGRGIGECGLLRGLSADDRPDYEQKLDWLMHNMAMPFETLYSELREFPSIQAGVEMALIDLKSKGHILFPSAFTDGDASQPINGLIWMGDSAFMKKQVSAKIKSGFRVLKMKIGAMDFEEEYAILKSIRNEFRAEELELRVDANGAFDPPNAMVLMNRLAKLDIHSIEQPIKKGQWQAMAALCEASPVPIALDEELIGLFTFPEREEMLDIIKPAYIILKPSFIGGFRGSEEWIALAEKRKVKWWVTSALESNIGLNAIAQWNFLQNNNRPSGLGTGSLYSNNFDSPLYVQDGAVAYDPSAIWNLEGLGLPGN